MSAKQTAQSLTVEVLGTLELEDLEALLQRGNAVLVAKAKQAAPIPTPLERLASSPVKLNVGGTYFSTSLDNLMREPNTFFSAMFSGRWDVKTDPHDKAVFVDRSPLVFEFVIDYLRTGRLPVRDLSPLQTTLLREEADFYQIASLLELLSSGEFDPKVKGNVQLSRGNSCATNLGGVWASVTSLVALSPSMREIKVKLIKGKYMMIGVAPKSILEEGKTYSNCGWYVYASNGCLYSQNGDENKPFRRKIEDGSVVTVKLDEEFNISFEVDEEDWGVAFPKVAKDYSVPLYLAITLRQTGDAAELLL